MATTVDKAYLGTGWSFPPSFVRNDAKLEISSDNEDIKQSLQILLGTELGERVMRSEYGTDLRRLLFEPLDESLKSFFISMIQDAILLYEPRIQVENILLEDDSPNGRVLITVEFLVPVTNSRLNLVYPFYKEEATNA